MHKLPKPHRPLGISLAVIWGLFLITILPAIELIWVGVTTNFTMRETGEFFGGVTLSGVDMVPLVVQALVSGLYLIVSVLVWRGKPRTIRWAWLAVQVTAVVFIVGWRALPVLMAQPSLAAGVDSAYNAQRNFLMFYTFLLVALVFYTVWFTRRWSSQAFFRGYYNEMDQSTLRELGVVVDE